MLDKELPRERRYWLLAFALVIAVTAIAAGGPIQVYFSKFFWCGRVGAGLSLHVLMALAAGQILIFLFAQTSDRMAGTYRWLQWLVLLLCVPPLISLAGVYPTTFTLLALAFTVSVFIAVAIGAFDHTTRKFTGRAFKCHSAFYLASLTALIMVHWLIGAALIAQFFLYRPELPLTKVPIILSVLGGAALAVAGGASFHRRNAANLSAMDIGAFPPVAVLLLALLRAKDGDGAFDTLLYKGTWPYQIAEWRTAGMTLIDSVGLGSNFQEMLNGFILIFSRDYTPSLISTMSIGALFLVLPCCIQVSAAPRGVTRVIFALAAVVTFCLTEVAAAQGTSYQEPLLVLLMTMALVNAWTWPIFAAAAVVTKLTVVAALPLLFVYRFTLLGGLTGSSLWKHKYALMGAVALMALFMFPQIDRNLLYSGRIFGVTETLVQWTDPMGPDAILAPGKIIFFAPFPRGGLLNNLILSTCNIFALNVICDVTYQQDAGLGFHVLPSSRAPVIGLLLALVALLVASLGRWPDQARGSRLLATLAAAAFLAGYLFFLTQTSQGRYFVVVSFMFVPLLLCLGMAVAKTPVARVPISGVKQYTLLAMLALIPIGDLLAGTFTNYGWNCRRDYFDAPVNSAINQPQTDLERFLKDLGKRYRATCPPPGLPPTIIVETNQTEILPPYLGLPVSISPIAQILRERFFKVDPRRKQNLPYAVAALILDAQTLPDQFTRSQTDAFQACFANEQVKVLCSTKIAPIGSKCARSAYPAAR